MTTIGQSNHPSYDPDTFARFISVVTKDWNLPAEFQAEAEFYFLRHWTAKEIYDNMDDSGIRQNEVSFFPRFKRDSAVLYKKALNSENSDTKFWLSFRAVRYPLGSSDSGNFGLKAYVLIQADTRKGN